MSIQLTFPDGCVSEFSDFITPRMIAEKEGMPPKFKKALGAVVDKRIIDMQTPITSDGAFRFFFEGEPEELELVRHTAAHVMAQAVRDIFPDTLFAIGPTIEDGFYYDFDLSKTFQPEDLEKIEKRMSEIIAADFQIVRKTLSREEANEFFKSDPYKLELIRDLPADVELTTYTQDTFTDLCRGPHLDRTGRIKVFKLLKIAGAYWRGDESRQMLQRIYGTAWRKKSELDEYLRKLEEAKKRDHRVLGRTLDLFSIEEEVGGGLVLWHPKGAAIRLVIENYWRDCHQKGGYQLVYTPHVGRSKLWQTSGHLDFFKENMFAPMDIEGQEYYVKPMNCPFHIHIYKSGMKSYRELPIRTAELGTVYRYERSGVLHGLLRVRGFTQDDAHIICRPDQVNEEVRRVVRFCLSMLKAFGFTEFATYIATKPLEKFAGKPEDWEIAESALCDAARVEGLDFEIDKGGGAFYGPKIDLKIKDALGREWQCSTIQFDFNLPERFDMTYIGEDGKAKRPYMIHRALLGSIERFFGCLIEHYAGDFPVWLAPIQATILTVSDKAIEYAKEISEKLLSSGFRVATDFGAEKIGKKIRTAELSKIPFMIVIGERDMNEGKVSVRRRKIGEQGSMKFDELNSLLKAESLLPLTCKS